MTPPGIDVNFRRRILEVGWSTVKCPSWAAKWLRSAAASVGWCAMVRCGARWCAGWFDPAISGDGERRAFEGDVGFGSPEMASIGRDACAMVRDGARDWVRLEHDEPRRPRRPERQAGLPKPLWAWSIGFPLRRRRTSSRGTRFHCRRTPLPLREVSRSYQ